MTTVPPGNEIENVSFTCQIVIVENNIYAVSQFSDMKIMFLGKVSKTPKGGGGAYPILGKIQKI